MPSTRPPRTFGKLSYLAGSRNMANRNRECFPEGFMLQLTEAEFSDLKFHFGTSRWGRTRKLPRAFTDVATGPLD